jgi:hypothetical protein
VADKNGIKPLAPPESNAWWPRLRSIFRVGYTDTLREIRGNATGIDLNPNLTNGYAYAEQRHVIAAANMTTNARGHQGAIPTPQELIKQVTGIGDPTRGR